MKILYISSTAFADCTIPLVKSLQDKGIDITYLLTVTQKSLHSSIIDINSQYPKVGIFHASVYKELTAFKNYFNIEKFFVSNRTAGSNYKTFSYWKEYFQLIRFIKKGKYDYIHTDVYHTGFRVILYKLFRNWITTVHDPFPHSGSEKAKENRYRKFVYNHSKGLVVLNQNQYDDFCKHYNLDTHKVLLNRLGIYENINMFAEEGETKRKNVLFFGRIAPYKGVEYLCKAMAIVQKQVPDATLTIAGNGAFDFDIEKYHKKYKIDLRNRFIPVKEIAMLLRQCSVSVCPYTDATQSGVVMTCFAMGKPVIATKVGGMEEMIEDGRTGLLIPPKDYEALAEAIIRILEDDKLRNDMSLNILYDYSKGDKAWAAIAEKYANFYKGLLE